MTVYETIKHKNTSKRLVFTRRRMNCTFLHPLKTPFLAKPKPIATISYSWSVEGVIKRFHPGIRNPMPIGDDGLRCPQDNTQQVRRSNALLSPRAPFQRRRL
jgi:hypothetical protein